MSVFVIPVRHKLGLETALHTFYSARSQREGISHLRHTVLAVSTKVPLPSALNCLFKRGSQSGQS